MRETIIRFSEILRWVLIIGWLIILLGLTYFLGIFKIDFEYSLLGIPVNSFYGITYLALFTFGFILVLFALLLILPTLDFNQREALNKYQRLFIAIIILGSIIISYSILVYLKILPAFEFSAIWFDYFVIGLIITISFYLIFIFSTKNFQELSLYNWLWYSLTISGIISIILSLLTYWSFMRTVRLSSNSWGFFYFIGIFFLIMGGLPVILSFRYSNRQFSFILGSISIIFIITGLLTYLAPTFALNGLVFSLRIFEYNQYFDYLYFGSLIFISGLAIASNLESIQKYFQQYSALWVIFLIFGLCQYTISALMVINDTHFTDLELGFLFQESVRGSLLFDMSWNVFLFNGL
ncbi:MAG: hypothetical protein ACXABI_13015, partial [Candidatus Hodarchaeales archaeon]